jgi:catechol 2,3-dioxygenase-like lactoylglutathione lyase family enzyme
MIIDHIGIAVGDYEESKAFFVEALAPLGIELVMEFQGWAGFGKGGKAELWFGMHAEKQRPMHIAFIAENRAQVRAFYSAARDPRFLPPSLLRSVRHWTRRPQH